LKIKENKCLAFDRGKIFIGWLESNSRPCDRYRRLGLVVDNLVVDIVVGVVVDIVVGVVGNVVGVVGIVGLVGVVVDIVEVEPRMIVVVLGMIVENKQNYHQMVEMMVEELVVVEEQEQGQGKEQGMVVELDMGEELVVGLGMVEELVVEQGMVEEQVLVALVIVGMVASLVHQLLPKNVPYP
jgi:hypothetical protein